MLILHVYRMVFVIWKKQQDAAAEAKRRGRLLARGVLPMTIFWSTYSGGSAPRATKSSTDADVKPSRPVKRTSDSMLHCLLSDCLTCDKTDSTLLQT
jgi:hypothetical protein